MSHIGRYYHELSNEKQQITDAFEDLTELERIAVLMLFQLEDDPDNLFIEHFIDNTRVMHFLQVVDRCCGDGSLSSFGRLP